MKIEYGYDLYSDLGRMEGTKITEEKYKEVENNKHFRFVKEWKTEYKDSTFYVKQYKLDNGYRLFIWKEVSK